MTNYLCSAKRLCAVLLAAVLLCMLALPAGAASSTKVGVSFWKEKSDKSALPSDGVDAAREAALIRQANGTYTLELPVQSFSVMDVSGHIAGLSIGDITYDGELTGELENGTGLLTIKNLPASVLTGSDPSKSLKVTCNLQMDLNLLGVINIDARMSVWAD